MEIVHLESWEHEWATHVGISRQWQRRDTEHVYSKNAYLQDDFIADMLSACCELAVAKYLKRYWSGSVWNKEDHYMFKHLPDVEPYYEVRRVRKPESALVVRHTDSHDKVAILTCAFDAGTRIGIIGALAIDEAWNIGDVPPWAIEDKGEHTRIIGQDKLYPPRYYED